MEKIFPFLKFISLLLYEAFLYEAYIVHIHKINPTNRDVSSNLANSAGVYCPLVINTAHRPLYTIKIYMLKQSTHYN